MSNAHDQDEEEATVEQYLQSIAESCHASAEHARDSASAIIQIRNLIACVIILCLIGFIISILSPFLMK